MAGIKVSSSFDRQANLALDDGFVKADIAARDAIPSGIRYEGQLCYVVADTMMYQLQGGIDNADWAEAGGGDDATKANLAGGNTFTGDQIFSDSVIRSVALNVLALTGGQAGAPTLTKDINTISSLNMTHGVKLPVLTVGKMVFIHNTGAQPVLVYPQSGDLIDNLDADDPVTLKLDKAAFFFATETGKWKSFNGGGSPLENKGDLYTYNTDNARLAVGANGYLLTADSAETTGLKWAPAPVANTIRAGVSSIADATNTAVVTFSTTVATTSYAINLAFENVTDTDPIFLQGFVTVKSATGFTVKFNAPTDSANYKMNWQAIVNA